MHPVFQKFSRSFAILCTIFITAVSRAKGQMGSCGHEELQRCSKPLSLITDQGLSLSYNKTDLDRICPDLKQAVHCIHKYTRFCMTHEARAHFRKLFHGTQQMVHTLCKPGEFQNEFLKHSSCMKLVEPETRECTAVYAVKMKEIETRSSREENIEEQDIKLLQKRKRQAADDGIKNICCAFKEYVSCNTNSMRRTCGQESAEFGKRYLDQMASEMITIHCKQFGPAECGVEYSSSSQISQLSLISLTVLLVLSNFLR